MLNHRLIKALLDPMLQTKQYAISQLRLIVDDRVSRMIYPWWRWTAYLALAITIERIENA